MADNKQPQILMPDLSGFHNNNDKYTRDRIQQSKSYQDLSTICIVPCVGAIPPKVVQSWRGMMTPMNQKFTMLMVENMEVGEAYSSTIDMILQHPELSKWKYILTLETDNCPPPDGLLKLYENMDKYDAIGGLYFTKGHLGQPMCYGRYDEFPVNFIPFMPQVDSLQPCRGLGMGFTLFSMKMFKDKNIPKPLFKTVQEYNQGNSRAYTQDLSFFENAGKLGYKFCCDSRVKIGHYDFSADFMW
jgi:hypothetical protein